MGWGAVKGDFSGVLRVCVLRHVGFTQNLVRERHLWGLLWGIEKVYFLGM